MEDFDENKAAAMMVAAIGRETTEAVTDAALEVLDLIYDYYEDHGSLDITAEGDDDDPNAIADYIAKLFSKNAPVANLSHDEILKMVIAEIEYEDSLL